MIMAESFHKSEKARNVELTTCAEDRPLIVQFAANNGVDLALASQLIYRWCDGVDLNCGCPQRWACRMGVGSCLIKKPELVRDMIRQTRSALSDNNFSVSVKIRLHNDIKRTVQFCQQMQEAGVSFITVHGRTAQQRHQPVSPSCFSTLAHAVRVPVVANGDVTSREQAETLARCTGARGVMAARGLLTNPAMFSGVTETPLQCVQRFVRICVESGASFSCMHHHLTYMLERSMPRALRRNFNMLNSPAAVLDFLREQLDVNVAQPAASTCSARIPP